MDVPIKNFSSGMLARLGFSIATIVDADILIIDEILSVGDYQFQNKCKKRIREMMDRNTTVLFVSHSIEQVKEICNKAIWIDRGHVPDDRRGGGGLRRLRGSQRKGITVFINRMFTENRLL